MKTRILSVLAVAMLAVAVTASAEIIGDPSKACEYLSTHALEGHEASKTAAKKLSGLHIPLYVDSSKVIAKVGHIPDVPYFSSIPQPGYCVALSPVILNTSVSQAGRTWLWLVAIAGTREKSAYHEAVMAAEHPLLRHVAGWIGMGNGVSKKAVLAAECQASRWMHSPSSLQEFRLIQGDLADNKYLPSIAQMHQKIVKCSQ
ncbi:hypothetical protein [Acidithiobacillus sp. AMEEHan]|uniref:hypothetical protein n=1 Tax=Acidithiobacillus sp. AMEEHan TaxID=2994951 RepID=UPI0027E43B2B|nr:hypothetical protein [Acidithiobacillus sp. AMEEHan]